MTPQELQNELYDAVGGPVFGRIPREVGELPNDYRPPHLRIVPAIDHLTSIKAHMRDLTPDEWATFAREVRGNLRIRLCNDEVINALLRAWASS